MCPKYIAGWTLNWKNRGSDASGGQTEGGGHKFLSYPHFNYQLC